MPEAPAALREREMNGGQNLNFYARLGAQDCWPENRDLAAAVSLNELCLVSVYSQVKGVEIISPMRLLGRGEASKEKWLTPPETLPCWC